jgi:hypothetical protein
MPDIVERSSRLVWCGRLQSAGSVRVHSAGAVQGRARSSSVRVHSAGVGRSSRSGAYTECWRGSSGVARPYNRVLVWCWVGRSSGSGAYMLAWFQWRCASILSSSRSTICASWTPKESSQIEFAFLIPGR